MASGSSRALTPKDVPWLDPTAFSPLAGLIDDAEIIGHLTFVIAASFDTLSSGTVSALYYLARNRGWQERVRDELCETITDPLHSNVAEIGRSLRAGTKCGTCLPELRSIVDHERHAREHTHTV